MGEKTVETRVCLSRKEAAAYCGITVMSFDGRGAPPPDVLVGTVRGWDPETIRAWDNEYRATARKPKGGRKPK